VTRANVEMLERIYGRWAAGDFSDISWMPEEFEFAYSDDFPDPATYRGREQAGRGWAEWLHGWHDVRISAAEYIDAGEHVVVDIHVRGTGRVSGMAMNEEASNLWTFAGGSPQRIELFSNRVRARAAAGL